MLATFTIACEEPKAAESRAGNTTAPPVVVDDTLELHVVATRRGPISLSIARGVELALAGALPVALQTTEPLAIDPRHRVGLGLLTKGIDAPVVDVVRFDGRWPDEATLVAHVEGQQDDSATARALRWDGSAWQRDDALADIATMPAPIALPDEGARFAVTPEGWVFAGYNDIAMWSPGATEWTTSELPDGTDAEIVGFVARAKDDVYAFGMRGLAALSARAGYIAHWDGKAWTSMPGPKCNDGIARLAPGTRATWAYCASEHYEPRRPPPTRELWRTTEGGAWERVTLQLDIGASRVRVRAQHAAAPTFATDVAITADGTLWIAMTADDETWTLARSSVAAQPLALPSDDELFPRPRR